MPQPVPSSSPSSMSSDPPTEAEWQGAPQAQVYGSDRLNCRTIVVGDWFRAQCGGSAPTVWWRPGEKPPRATVTTLGGVTTVTTPLEGHTQEMGFAWSSKFHAHKLSLSGIPTTSPVGTFSEDCDGPAQGQHCCLDQNGEIGLDSHVCEDVQKTTVCRAFDDCYHPSHISLQIKCVDQTPLRKDPRIRLCQ